MTKRDSSPPDLPDWLRGDPIAEHLRSIGRPVTRAAWLEAAYGTSNEAALDYDHDTREWVRRHFPADPHEPVRQRRILNPALNPSEALGQRELARRASARLPAARGRAGSPQ